jgi:hypothetical protein
MTHVSEQIQPPVNFEVQVPSELEGGVYANFLSVWHSPYEFTLDFASTQPGREEEGGMTVPCRVGARVKVPVTVMFEILKALNGNMTKYEETFGEIKAPETRTEGEAE